VFAKAFQSKLHCIHYLHFQTPVYALPKYVLQAIRTLQVLFAERPQAVHVQNPPVICGLVVSFYCYIMRARFVFDHHSAAFGRAWDWALPLQRLLARRAVTNIVTTQHWAEIIRSWGAQALVMGDPFLTLPPGQEFSIGSGFSIAFVSTFASDEPLDAVLQAATELPQVHFYITGNANRKPKSFHDSLPMNVSCTGFLPDAQYIGLLRAVDVIMVLTTRDHTLQLGGCEAVSIGQPLITSDWPFLREFFSIGTVHVNNTCDGIRDGILLMMNEQSRFKSEITVLRANKRKEWDTQFSQLNELVTQSISSH
jgi:glycosyltransferase involved in cell wall biosynthesis